MGRKEFLIALLAALLFVFPSSARAQYFPIYGGPTFDGSTSTGYLDPALALHKKSYASTFTCDSNIRLLPDVVA